MRLNLESAQILMHFPEGNRLHVKETQVPNAYMNFRSEFTKK